MEQVWGHTEQLLPFKARRFTLALDQDLMTVLQKLAAQVPDACISPCVWRHHRSRVHEQLKSEHASRCVSELQFQSDIKRIRKLPSIASLPLVDSEHGPVHKTEALATFPPCFEDHWTSGPLSHKPQPKWTKFHRISFENAQTLLRQAGACGGVYQIWLSRSELQPDGKLKMVMRTELYVGSGIDADLQSPQRKPSKVCYFGGAWERGFDIDIRFLHLDGMSLSEVRTVEDHYLAAAKWPWNKVQNGFVRTHPEWDNRLLLEGVCMLKHFSDYQPQTRHKQGLAQLGVQQDAIGMANQVLDTEQAIQADAVGFTEVDSESNEGDMLMDDEEFDDGELSDEDFDDLDVDEEEFVDFGHHMVHGDENDDAYS